MISFLKQSQPKKSKIIHEHLLMVVAAGGYGGLGQTGVKLGGMKYMLIAGEPGSVVRGKKGGEEGVTVKKTMTALVIGIYSKGVQPADCNVIVENMGDYLAGQNI